MAELLLSKSVMLDFRSDIQYGSVFMELIDFFLIPSRGRPYPQDLIDLKDGIQQSRINDDQSD